MIKKKNIIKKIAETHFKNSPKSNLSVQLGLDTICIFYKTAFESEYAKVFYSSKDDEILCASIVFINYLKFETELKKKLIWLILLKLFTFSIKLSVILDILKKKKIEKKALKKIMINCHLGMFFTNKKLKPESTFELIKNFKKMHFFARQKSKNIWAVVDNNNKNALKFLEKLGYRTFFFSNNKIYLNKAL